MARFIKNRMKARGQAPGSLIFLGEQKMESAVIQLIEYNHETYTEKQCQIIKDATVNINSEGVSWINIYGLHDTQLIQSIGSVFNIHPLLLEDILNTDQRPKYVYADTHDLFILKMLYYDQQNDRFFDEQITLVLGNHYVLTLQEKTADFFEPVRERIRNNNGRVRLNHNDYLAYALLDTIVDNYTLLIEQIGSKVEITEDKIFGQRNVLLGEEIYKLKTELNFLRKTIRPVKDAVSILLKTDNTRFLGTNKVFLHDLSDLLVQSADALEIYNNLVSDQLNIYNTSVSNRMNEVMKVLTVFASIFIPLTFITGIYGMNFHFMPELSFKYAYPLFWFVIVGIGAGLFYYFKNKKWF